jgi:GAF domain-containing protein
VKLWASCTFQATNDVPQLNASELSFKTTFAAQVGLSIANIRLREALRIQSVRDPLTGLYDQRRSGRGFRLPVRRGGICGYPSPAANLEAAQARAEALRLKIRELTILYQGKSMGMISADAALYEAKRAGGNVSRHPMWLRKLQPRLRQIGGLVLVESSLCAQLDAF